MKATGSSETRDLRFSLRCGWGFKLSGNWCYVAGKMSSDVSKYRCTDQLLMMKAPWSFEISETPQPITECQIPEAFNPLLPKRWYLFTQIIGVTSQMTAILIFTGVRTSNLNSMGILLHSHIRWYPPAHIRISVIALRSVHLLLQTHAHL